MSNKMNPSKNCWQNKEWLEEQYFKNKLTFAKIGKLVNKTDKTIQHFFRKHGLISRSIITGLKGKDHPRWKGGRAYDSHGYIRFYHPEQHAYRAKCIPYVLEHVLVVEKKLGRPLKHPEVVHHNDGIINHNSPENLRVFANPKEHNAFEWKLNLFIKQILHGDLAPHLKNELQSIFESYSLVKER